ncbi:hypothetical protein P9112_005728 [Eukaryota sp. TZLM1-RC]
MILVDLYFFCGTNFGGVDFHKSSYLCKAAFIGGGKNFIYEFVNRFPEKIHLIENCGSSYLISLQQEIETLSLNIWAKCFPSDIVELPSRSLLSLPLTFAKLQKKILKVLENLDYILVAVNDSGRPLLFCGTNFGGVDFHKSSCLCKAAFIGGGKNFIYEFVNRFPEKIHLIENCGSSYLISLQHEIETLSPNIWAKCFPSDIVELPSRSLLSLPLTFAKLQKKILKVLENLDYILVAVNDSGRPLLFCGTNFGGVDFHKSSYLCKAAFIGGGKNFIYEFVNRFPEKIHLIENCGSSYLISLQQEIETVSPNIWAKCFPSDIVELPSRSLLSLPLTFAKLQKKILKVLENLDYIVRLSLAKEKNPVFANFLIDLEDSCSSCLISQIPNIYGLLLNDHQWTTAMRMRCFLWPCSLPNDLICRCKSVVTLSHILNCKYFITYRSIVHDSVRDQLYAMCKSFNIEAFIEPLVRKLSSDQTDDSFGKRRADLVAPGIDGVLNVVDVVSVDVCKNSAARLVYSADSPLSNAEKKKIKKYEEPLAQLGRVEHVKYQFVPFAISLFGNIGLSGLHFFENFKKVLLNRSGKTMNSTFWLNRIVFCIFKSIPTMISKALLAIGVEYERNAVTRFSNSDACLEDIEF